MLSETSQDPRAFPRSSYLPCKYQGAFRIRRWLVLWPSMVPVDYSFALTPSSPHRGAHKHAEGSVRTRRNFTKLLYFLYFMAPITISSRTNVYGEHQVSGHWYLIIYEVIALSLESMSVLEKIYIILEEYVVSSMFVFLAASRDRQTTYIMPPTIRDLLARTL